MADREQHDVLLASVVALRAELAALRLPLRLDAGGAGDRATSERIAVLDQLDDYVVPRLTQLEAPLLAVVGGSTGAGKSTLVNSLVRAVVSTSGVLRPTTRSPVLAHHPDDERWFADQRILPSLSRTSGSGSDPGGLHLVAEPAVPPGLALLDAPDLDSVVEANRDLAGQLLAAADLWLFVTTAARYADAVPWEMLRSAADRGTALAVVLNRLPSAGADDITHHLAEMLARHDLGDSPLFVIPEMGLTDDGLLPAEAAEPIRAWLADLAGDAASRAAVARRTVDGAVRSLSRRVATIAAYADRQRVAHAALERALDASYETAYTRVDEATQDGSLLRGEVLARWQEFVGTGEIFRGLEQRLGVLRDRVTDFFRARPAPEAQVTVALETGLEAVILDQADAAADRAQAAWAALAGGPDLVGDDPAALATRSDDLLDRTARAVRDWQGYVLDLVREEGQGRRTTARFLSLGVNGLGVALMVVVFAHTGGLTGIEVGVAGGTGVVGQRVLEAVFGDQAVRQLTDKARADLRTRVRSLLADERSRFDQRLAAFDVDPEAGTDLRTALRRVEAAS
ncbi:MAG: dynamin family protein [Actinomycetota bacterium]|nr:dynamin family protein [Actinomycetota bacterium]